MSINAKRPTLQQAKKKYLHRFTVDHKPKWARGCNRDGSYSAPHYISDQEWYDNTIFPGHPDCSPNYCNSTGQTWPLGRSLTNEFMVSGSFGKAFSEPLKNKEASGRYGANKSKGEQRRYILEYVVPKMNYLQEAHGLEGELKDAITIIMLGLVSQHISTIIHLTGFSKAFVKSVVGKARENMIWAGGLKVMCDGLDPTLTQDKQAIWFHLDGLVCIGHVNRKWHNETFKYEISEEGDKSEDWNRELISKINS